MKFALLFGIQKGMSYHALLHSYKVNEAGIDTKFGAGAKSMRGPFKYDLFSMTP